jgi:N-methylhydantoinase A
VRSPSKRGRDPRTYVLVVAGGGGAAHGFEVGQELGISTVLVPPYPGVASAQGMLMADLRYEQSRTVYRVLDELSEDDLATYVHALVIEVTKQLSESAVACDQVMTVVAGDCRYRNQTYELTVPMSASKQLPGQLSQAFHHVHRARYGHAFADAQVELINIRAAAVGTVYSKDLGTPSWTDFPDTTRNVYWGPARGWLDTPVLSRGRVVASGGIAGPAIVEQSDATVVVPPAARVNPITGGNARDYAFSRVRHRDPRSDSGRARCLARIRNLWTWTRFPSESYATGLCRSPRDGRHVTSDSLLVHLQ